MKRVLCRLVCVFSLLAAGSVFGQTNFMISDFCPDQGSAAIQFDMLRPGPVKLVVEHVFTQIPVRTLLDDNMSAGQHQVLWNGQDDQGQPVGTGVYNYVLSGSAWQVEQWGLIDCGNDAVIQSRVVVGGHDVSMVLTNILPVGTAVDIGIFDTDNNRVIDFSQTAGGGPIFFWWGIEGSQGEVLPAGDYVYRVSSTAHSADIPFTLNPIERGSLSVAITDSDGLRVIGATSGADEVPLLKGPLQRVELDFGRRFTAPELEHVLDSGLIFDGFFDYFQLNSVTVKPDSTGIIYDGFDLSRPWPDIAGPGALRGYGLFSPDVSLFRLGYDHEGFTWRDQFCQSSGPEDPSDWIVNPGPFYTTPSGTIDPPCDNPVLADQIADIRFFLTEPGAVSMYLINSGGERVRRLVEAELSAGYYSIYWNRRDDAGVEVPPGLYHLIWQGYDVDRLATVASGDIMISASMSAAPDVIASPALPTLHANYPNPFNPTTRIGITLPAPGFARLTVLAVDGKRVTTLVEGQMEAGEYSVVWDGRDFLGRTVPSGAYFYRLEADGMALTRRMVLLK